MAAHTLNVLSLCSGIGGLDLGIRRAFGSARTICYVEREAAAASILARRIDAGDLDGGLIWSDLSCFPIGDFRGRVDCVVAGFPCQPWSAAGKRKGVSDDRWIWDDIVRIIDGVGARLVILENVPGIASGGGLAVILRSLAARGFDAEWDSFRTSDVGAPHKRERIFIMAYAEHARFGVGGSPYDQNRHHAPWHDVDGCHSFPPSPDDADGWRRWLDAGGPAPSEPRVRRGTNGTPEGMDDVSWADRLRALGNGVVPQCVALAVRELGRRLRDGEG